MKRASAINAIVAIAIVMTCSAGGYLYSRRPIVSPRDSPLLCRQELMYIGYIIFEKMPSERGNRLLKKGDDWWSEMGRYLDPVQREKFPSKYSVHQTDILGQNRPGSERVVIISERGSHANGQHCVLFADGTVGQISSVQADAPQQGHR